MIEVTARQSFVGHPVRGRRADRHLRPGGCGRTASSWSPTSLPAASTSSPTGWSRSCRSGATSAATTPAPPCAITSICRPPAGRHPGANGTVGHRRVSCDRVPLGVLDLVPISSGSSAADALRNTLDLAQRAEDLGYRRYWFAEHHLNPGVAGSSPAVLIALVAGATRTHPSRLGRRAERSPHRPVGRRGVRADRRPLPRPARPGPRPLGGPQLHRRERLRSRTGAAPRPAPLVRPRHYTDNGLLIPERPSFGRMAASPRVALTADLLQQAGAESADYGDLIHDIVGLVARAPSARPTG